MTPSLAWEGCQVGHMSWYKHLWQMWNVPSVFSLHRTVAKQILFENLVCPATAGPTLVFSILSHLCFVNKTRRDPPWPAPCHHVQSLLSCLPASCSSVLSSSSGTLHPGWEWQCLCPGHQWCERRRLLCHLKGAKEVAIEGMHDCHQCFTTVCATLYRMVSNSPTAWPNRLRTPNARPSANSSGPWMAPCDGQPHQSS